MIGQIFRPDKLFLYFVIFCCSINSYFFYIQNKIEVEKIITNASAVVVGYSQFGFVKKPVLLMQNNLYLAESKGKLNLNVGQNIIFKGRLKPHTFDEGFNQYLLTTAILGTLQIESIYIFEDCNLICLFFKNIDNIKYNYTKNYNTWFCSEDKKLWFSNLASCIDLAGLAVGFSIGVSQNLTNNTRQNFKDLGLTHLIAVSGFQVVLMIDIATKLSENLKINFKLRRFLQLGLVLGLVLIVGLQAPVLRAAISTLISLLAKSIGRNISAIRSLIWAGLILAFWNPAIVFSLSFQLSFAATLGLILLPNFNFITNSKLPIFLQEIISSFLTSLAATLWTLPLIVQINNKISGISVFANVLVSPFISISTILAFLGQIPILGELFLLINSAILILILNIVELASKINIFLEFYKFGVWEMAGYYGFLLTILFTLHQLNNKYKNISKPRVSLY
jgi:ComEC/Rec2-related protein